MSSAQQLPYYNLRNSILLQATRCIQVVHGQNMETSLEIFFKPAWSEENGQWQVLQVGDNCQIVAFIETSVQNMKAS